MQYNHSRSRQAIVRGPTSSWVVPMIPPRQAIVRGPTSSWVVPMIPPGGVVVLIGEEADQAEME